MIIFYLLSLLFVYIYPNICVFLLKLTLYFELRNALLTVDVWVVRGVLTYFMILAYSLRSWEELGRNTGLSDQLCTLIIYA